MTWEVSGVVGKHRYIWVIKTLWFRISFLFNCFTNQSHSHLFDCAVVLHVLCELDLNSKRSIGFTSGLWVTNQSFSGLNWISLCISWSGVWDESGVAGYEALLFVVLSEVWRCTGSCFVCRVVLLRFWSDCRETWQCSILLTLLWLPVILIMFNYVVRRMVANHSESVTEILNTLVNNES